MDGSDPISEEIDRIRRLVEKKWNHLAEERLYALVESHPDDPRVKRLRAECLVEWRDFLSARLALDELLADDPDDFDLLRMGVMVSAGNSDGVRARELGGRLVQKHAEKSDVFGLVAEMFDRIGEIDEAERVYELLIQSPVTNPSGQLGRCYLKARLLAARGNREGAVDLLSEEFESIEPGTLPDPHNKQYREALFLLSKYRDRMGDYDGAWRAARMAHEDDDSPWNMDRYEQSLLDLQAVFTKEMTPKLAHADEVDIEPLIILGNPRSGTTLLDTILGMHPDVVAGGELSAGGFVQYLVNRVSDSYLPYPACLYDLRASDANKLGRIYEEHTGGLGEGGRYLSNKALAMHSQLGLLSLALPRMRVVNLFRHPLDNCISCYTMNLLASGHPYTNTLEHLGRTWIARYKMQQYWPEVLEQPMIEVHYEDLVSDQETQTRRLLEFLDVGFDEACLNFHESTSMAATLSYEQVRQKMYTSSKGRWRNYEKHIGPLIDLLEPYL